MNLHCAEIRRSETIVHIPLPLYEHDEGFLESKPDLTEELTSMVKLACPVVMATFFEFLPDIISIMLAGNMNSPETERYVNAATFSIMLVTLTSTAIGLGLASALDTLCSQAYGAKRGEKIGEYFQTGVLVLSVNLLLVFTVTWKAEGLLKALGQDAEVARLSASFTLWMLPGIPFLYVYELTRKAMQAQNVMTPFVVIGVIGNVVNLAVSYGLAYHTSVGFNGIAVGTSAGNIILPLLLVPYFMWRPQHLNQWWVCSWSIKTATNHLDHFLRLGFPGMLMNMLEMWGLEALCVLSGLLPDSVAAVAAHSVLVNVNLLVDAVFSGLAVAANIRVGNCLGAGLPMKAKLTRTVALRITLVISSVIAVLLYNCSGIIPRLFLGGTDGAAILASQVLAIWAPFNVVDGLNCVTQGVFRGAGKQKSAAITNAVAYYAVGIPVGALLAFQGGLGVEGLWFGTGIGDVVAVCTLALLMKTHWGWDKLANEATQRANL